MGKRFVCDNGAISGEFFARVSFKHLASRATRAVRTGVEGRVVEADRASGHER